MEIREQWGRLANALAGRGALVKEPCYQEVSLDVMEKTLSGLAWESWGKYAFSREPLEGKFTVEQKMAYTQKAVACGREWANKTIQRYGTRDPQELAQKMGIQVVESSLPTGGEQVLFAQFIQPNEVTIFTDCLDRAATLREGNCFPLLEREALRSTLLAHELFHAVEERHSDEIYTKTEKVELWHKPFSNRSAIVCLSEIAAMSFAQTLMELDCSPYILDVLLVYAYDKNTAWGLYDEICSLT